MTSPMVVSGTSKRSARAPFTILVVEDNPTDAELMLHAI